MSEKYRMWDIVTEQWRYFKYHSRFTGYKDEDMLDIYEGDIWQRDTFISTVNFQFAGWALVKTESSKCYQYPSFHSNASTGTVIGNIHENPELLGE